LHADLVRPGKWTAGRLHSRVGVSGAASQPQVDPLSAHYSCLWFDNRGLGESLPMGGLLTVELMAEDVLALMNAQGGRARTSLVIRSAA
jgi:hypothetical protein